MEQKVLSVTQINEQIQAIVDSNSWLKSVAISGEISNYKKYPSGHHYFTLKDEQSSLKCVMFKSSAVRLRLQPENGMKVVVFGRISVYPRDGTYQLYCTGMALDGVGDLHAAFEQLKAKLLNLGLFDPNHKKPIPRHPKTIGIITSSAGAAIHDILRIINHRWPMVTIKLLPVRVQGAEAPSEIAAAIQYANFHSLADVIIVGRGGGSLEDLWAFNDEQVAYAIFNSNIPIISAVGHEPDVTISDYVADLRAATPSNAAELVVPDQNNIRQYLDQVSTAMASNLLKQIRSTENHLNTLAKSSVLQSPLNYFNQKRSQILIMKGKLLTASQKHLENSKHRYIRLASSLDAMSPLKVLSRGYSLATNMDGVVIRSASQLSTGDHITISFYDGSCKANITDVKE